MNFLHILAVFTVSAVVCACIRYAQYLHQASLWRREKKNFRILRVADVARYALPKSAVLTTAAWITLTNPILALTLAAAALGHSFQRVVEA